MPDPEPALPDQQGASDVSAKPRPGRRERAWARIRPLVARFLMPTAFVICAAVLVFYFHQDESANPMSRLMTVMALVDDHTLQADRWKDSIADRAEIKGHTYSDKAPFSSFLVVPFYAAWRVFNPHADAALRQQAALHLGNGLAATLPFVIVGLLVLSQLRRLGPTRASQVALIAMLSTCLFQYGNTYYGHMLSACLLLGSYLLAVKKGRPFWAGVLGGLGVITEYPIFLPEALIALWLLGPKLSGWRRVLLFAAGGLPSGVALLVYNWVLTGNPLTLSYSHVTDAWAPMRLAFGMRFPSPDAAWELLFGQFRGVLFWAPTLGLLIPLALRKRYGLSPESRREYRLLLVLSITGFLFVCSYFKWDGGWCTGPRHLAPILTLLLYEGAAHLAADWRLYRVPFFALGLFGIFANLAAAATGPILPEDHRHPLFEDYWPQITDNKINWHNLPHELLGWKDQWWLVLVWAGLFVGALGLLRLAGGVVNRLTPSQPAVSEPLNNR